jgi:citrate synthase
MPTSAPTASGLDEVVVASTALSHVDGARGELIIHGCTVESLAEWARFEDVCALLWNGAWPSLSEARDIREELAQARQEAFAMLPSLGDALTAPDAMEGLRAAVGHLRSAGDVLDRARLTGAIAVFAAAWGWRRANRPPISPRRDLSHAADVLRMLSGVEAAPASVAALNAYWCTVVDHGMNASTFTARVVTSTGSDAISAVVAALGALKGPLHGGAPGPVLDMLDAIGDPSQARTWLEQELGGGRRIMGMGHRIYRVRDPRAAALERAIRKLEASGVPARRLPLARVVEREAERLLAERHPNRPLRANVEFYTAVLLDAVQVPRSLFTPMFAASRVAGWCAHIDEQRAVGRLIRPASTYVGPLPNPKAPDASAKQSRTNGVRFQVDADVQAR